MPGRLRVTLRKSPISYTAKARGSVRALGLRRIGQSVEVADTPQSRGMTRAVSFLVEVEELQDAATGTARVEQRKTVPAETPTQPVKTRAPRKPRTGEEATKR